MRHQYQSLILKQKRLSKHQKDQISDLWSRVYVLASSAPVCNIEILTELFCHCKQCANSFSIQFFMSNCGGTANFNLILFKFFQHLRILWIREVWFENVWEQQSSPKSYASKEKNFGTKKITETLSPHGQTLLWLYCFKVKYQHLHWHHFVCCRTRFPWIGK